MKETDKKLGHPADCKYKKKQFRQKDKDNKIKKKEVLQTLIKSDCLFKINYQYPNHHWNIRAKTQTRSNARLAEFRIEEHHEERVGTNKI